MAADSSAVAPGATVPLAEGLHPTREAWEKATAAVLRKSRRLAEDAPDADVWSVLSTSTLDGVTVTALGTPDQTADLPDPGLPGQAPFTRGATAARELGAWDIRGWFTDPDADRTAEHVLTDLENGVNSLWLTVGPDGIDAADLPRILEPVFLDLAPVVLDAPHDPLAAAQALAAILTDRAVTPAPGTSFGADPLGASLRGRGHTDTAVVADLAQLACSTGVGAIVVDGTAVHDLGGSDVTELAWITAAGAAYLRLLTAAGLDVDTAASLLQFRIAVTDEQFPTIAKLRAARQLWARVAEVSGVSGAAAGQVQHAVTSRPMMSAYDPYVNMLRTTVAAFAAGVGGAASVTVLPFDEPLGLPEPFSRRIARNTSSLLISESHVARVTDPAGGSHVVERLTHDLAHAAWELVGAMESAGGAAAAVADGAIAAAIAETVATRSAQIATRERPITGVSEFPNLHEELPERRPYPTPPVVHRYGADFEAMRRNRAATAVFLATLGPIAAHTARATFAANLFAAGGIDTVTAGATGGVDDVLAAYDGAPVVCLAGPDAAYAEWGAELVSALRAAGARHIVLAGQASLGAEIGADSTAALGLDALAFLHQIRGVLA